MIVVTTPTGKIGAQLVSRLLAAGEEVRVIAREPVKLSAEIQHSVEVVQGSANDPVVLNKAFEGAASLFWLLPPPFSAENLQEYCISFTAPVAEAVTAQGVERVVAVSSLGRELRRNAGLASLLHLMDEVIESSGVNYRALWCPGFMENMLLQLELIKRQGVFLMMARPDLKMPLVATRDIAATAARLLTDKSWTQQGGVDVLGPEDLSPLDMADIMSDVLDRSIHFQQVSAEDYRAQLMRSGASEAFAQGMTAMATEISEGLYTALRTTDNTTPTSFYRWCEEVLKPTVQR